MLGSERTVIDKNAKGFLVKLIRLRVAAIQNTSQHKQCIQCYFKAGMPLQVTRIKELSENIDIYYNIDKQLILYSPIYIFFFFFCVLFVILIVILILLVSC